MTHVNLFLSGNLEEDKRIVELLDQVHLHIIPQLDPDGVNRAVIGDCSGEKNQGTSEFHSLSLQVILFTLYRSSVLM